MVGDGGLRAFVDAETREILALLGESDGAEQGGCCGGSCGCAGAQEEMTAEDVAAAVAAAAGAGASAETASAETASAQAAVPGAEEN